MIVIPTDIAAYTPASINAEISRLTKSIVFIGTERSGRRGDGCGSRPTLGINDLHLAARLVLYDHERRIDLPVLSEPQNLPGQQGILQLHGSQRVADGVPVEASGSFDGVRQGPHRSEERRVGKECRSRWSPY